MWIKWPVVSIGRITFINCFLSACAHGANYGPNCSLLCVNRHCKGQSQCSYTDGECQNGCQAGWKGTDCTGINLTCSSHCCVSFYAFRTLHNISYIHAECNTIYVLYLIVLIFIRFKL